MSDEPTESQRADLDRADLDRTGFLVKYQPWLRLLARLEIDNRFGEANLRGKFSESDVVQQTMAEAWQGWQQFRGESEAQRMAWLRAILGNQFGHLVRRFQTKQRDVAREVSIDCSLSQSAEKLGQLMPADATSPSQHAIANENQILLAKALERLPEDYREVIVLRNLEELAHEEVAERMNRKSGAVRMLWMRALAKLKEELDQVRN